MLENIEEASTMEQPIEPAPLPDLNEVNQVNEPSQANQDAQVMEQQLDTQEIAQPIEGIETAGISSYLAKQIAKRKALAGIGEKNLEQREAAQISESEEIKASIIQETKLDDLDPEEPYQINFDTIQGLEDIKKTFGVMNEMNREAIQTQRRNVIPDKELNDLSNDLSSDPETIKKVLGLKPGEILAPEYILSMKQVLDQSTVKLRDLSEKITRGEATDKDKISFHKQWEFHSQFTTQFMGVRAEYGRGLRALGVKTDESPNELTEIMNRMSAGTLDENTLAQQILLAKDNKSLNNVIKNQKKGFFQKAGDAFSELFISSILSGVQTHIVNVTSNAMKTVAMPLDTMVASMFKADGTDVIGKGEALAQVKGIWEANIEALDTAWRVMKTGEAYGNIDKLDVDYVKAITANSLGIKEGKFATGVDAFGKFVRFSTDNLMGAEDAFFKVLNERGKIRQLAHRKAFNQGLTGEAYDAEVARFMENPPASAKQEAIQTGLEATYQQQLGKAGRGIQQFRDNVAGGKFIMPFIKTPINLIYEGFVERTPLALTSKKYKDALEKGGSAAQMAKAKLAVGTAVNATLLSTFYGLEYAVDKENGAGTKLIGAYPLDPKLRQTMRDAGIQENSIEVTDENGKKTYTSFDKLEPFNTVFKLYANIMQVQKYANIHDLDPDVEKEYGKMAAGISMAFAEATVNQTFMKGVKNIIDAFGSNASVSRIESIVGSYANALVPHSSAFRNIAKMFDDNIRDADSISTKVMKSLPYFNLSLPKTLDNFGKPIKYDKNLLPAFYSPGKEGSNDIVRNEIYRVTESTKTVPVYKPKKTIGGYKMSAQQYHYYVDTSLNTKIDGKTFYEAIKETIGSYSYKTAPDHVKAMILRDVRDTRYIYGKGKLMEKYPEIKKYDIDKKQFEIKLLQGEF